MTLTVQMEEVQIIVLEGITIVQIGTHKVKASREIAMAKVHAKIMMGKINVRVISAVRVTSANKVTNAVRVTSVTQEISEISLIRRVEEMIALEMGAKMTKIPRSSGDKMMVAHKTRATATSPGAPIRADLGTKTKIQITISTLATNQRKHK